jgi:putative Ca2+/H+ antiporter (TMEM165/GDT1 family)
MHLSIIALVFGVIFISELPDKSMFATLILSTRYPSFLVWFGAASAFLVHVILAVSFGRFLTLLPHTILAVVIGVLFLLGAGLLTFGKHGLEDNLKTKKLTATQSNHPLIVFSTAFSVVFIGEWGDITQIVTANYAARYHDSLNVAIGAVLGLWLVTALAVIIGNRALSLISPRVLQRVTAVVLAGFGIASLVSIF